MATVTLASLGLGNADLTAIGKLSETGLSQVEIADAVVEGDKLKKGNKLVAYDGHLVNTSNPHNTTAGQVGAYTKAEVDGIIDNIPTTDLSDYYNKAQVDSLIGAIPETDLTNYYNKTEVYNKLESYSKAEVDSLISSGGADLSDYYTKAQVDSLIDAIPETDLTNYYNKTEVDNLIPDISTKQDTLVSATNIKTINGQSVLGSGDLVISGGGAVDLSDYYKKTETYSKVEVDTKIADIPETDLSGYYNKTQVDSLIDAIPETDLSEYYKKTETYNKIEVDTIISNIPETDLSGYYDKAETETLLSNKVDKEVGKGLSTNDFTDTFKQALELNKVQNISTDSVNKKLVVTYTNGTFVDLNLDDIVTDVKVEGAVLDATTNVLTILSSDGGADVTVDLSVFVTNQTLSNALVGKADKVHTHSTSHIDGLDTTLSNKVTKNEAIVGDTKTKITYDSNGLVINGADLSASDIPNLPQSKITNLEINLANKIDKGVGVVGATKTKVTYNNDGIITGGADLEEADLPNISQAKITNLVSDLSNKQSRLISGTNIKTINGQSVLGSGNIVITAESASPLHQPIITSPANGTVDYIGSITSTYSTSEYFVGVQDWVRWEASTDENFTTLIDSYEGSDNLTNWTPAIGGLYLNTTVYVRTKQGLDNYLSVWSEVISFTTPNIYVATPTLTVTGAPNNVTLTPLLSGSAFNVHNGVDTHISTDWQVLKASDSSVVWESMGDTVNKTSIKTGDLVERTAYIFNMRYKGATYGYSQWVQVTGTTTISIGVQGKKGFGVAPTDKPFAVLGLAEMTGTNDLTSDNYGNYIHTNGSIVCWCPKAYYRVGSSESPRFATYGANALDIVGVETFSTTAEANTAGYALHRAFINAGAEQSGFFIDKYMNSKDGTTASKSIFGGVPISLAKTADYTVSNGMTGCTGILADAVVLSKARGTRWNTATAFMYGYLAMVSVAQAQSATNTTDVAWYDPTGVTNYPKGCNNNALSDVYDTTVVYVTAGDSGNANKPKTGATVNFAKTTHNGSNNGVADLNGGMWEVVIGITNFGTSAAATAVIANDQIYVLKQGVDVATLTGGWNTANAVWGDATNLATKYDLVTSPHPLGSSTVNVYWGNGTNAVLQNDLSGANRDVCGFIPKNSSSTGATGANLFGNDYLTINNRQNMVPLTCGRWNYSALAGVFSRYFSSYRSGDYVDASFRASAYVAL